ncbi:MAG: hypothetical protein LC797_20690 [Chloroflexi bacterium]|nr:hypothetical protein [Chloroflexota bacterium]
MATDDAPPVVWVSANPINVNVSLHDVIAKVAEKASNLTAPPGADPKLVDLLKQYNDLTNQLKDVASQINAIDPTILGGKP